jgi:hypothetical protein
MQKVCTLLYENGMIRVALADVLTSRTNSVPGRLIAGPCGSAMKLRQVASPSCRFCRSTRPNSSGVISPEAKERESERTEGISGWPSTARRR